MADYSIQQLYNEQYIQRGDILIYKRHNYQVKSIYKNGRLEIILADDKKKKFCHLFELEQHILGSNENITCDKGNVYDRIFIIHNDTNKGNITELKERYVMDHKADVFESQAKKLDGREISPIFDIEHLKQFDIILKEFHKKFNKIIPLTCVNEGLVDNKEALIVFVYVPEETPVNLPSEFMGYPVIISYGVDFKFHHRFFHKDLMPGISIGSSRYLPDACTLGGLFQNTEEPDKKFLLTTKHGFGKNDGVFQPGILDQIDTSLCAKVTRYHFLGANPTRQFLDYAFCEIENDRGIPKIPNTPLGSNITISSIKTSVSNNENFVWVQKVGRTTSITRGLIQDKLVSFLPPLVIKGKEKKNGKRVERFALKVTSKDNRFGQPGDSGSPVFDDNGKLWGIYIGSAHPYYYVTPIHLILHDVQKRFGDAKFELITQSHEELTCLVKS
ncbi:8223_t:CDS:2 [Funneliformis geosporum]|uniref:8223_t:CDS:1 n=1 Tax=Funneliformis geosporum TaxID=1117311 RepID=A0A9W4SWU8_9GLOM|nr:8223_t:CDS:2 [Funneliformis geosporum]